MIRNFERSLSLVLKHEGGFVDHPRDPGGATNLGVTIGTARRLGIDVDGDGDTDIVDIKKLRTTDAAKVYRHEYWNKVAGDKLPDGVDYAVFDFAVNSGVSRASKYLQRAVGVKTDGEIGPVTIAAAKARPAAEVIEFICDSRMDFLRDLKTWPTFGKGWTRRVAGVRAEALKLAKQPPKPDPKPSGKPVSDRQAPVAPSEGHWALRALAGLLAALMRILKPKGN
jgi:lysozyme family protein